MNGKLMDAVGAAEPLLKDRGLDETDLHVLLALAYGAEESGLVMPIHETIIRMTGLPWTTVELSMQRLRRAGIIERTRENCMIPFGPHPDDQERLVLQPQRRPDWEEIELPPPGYRDGQAAAQESPPALQRRIN
jgi:hypothetical protein